MTFPDSKPRRCAVRISRLAAHILGPSRPELAAAMMCEVSYIERGLTALAWSVGCLFAACAARVKSRHPILFYIGASTPLILWHLGTIVCFGMLGLLSMLGLIAKLLHPASVGLWVDLPLSAQHRYEAISNGLLPVRVGHDHIVFGLPYDGTPATEILGPCFAPLMVGLLLFATWSVRRSLLAALGSARPG